MDGFDRAKGKPDLEDTSPYSVAQQYHRYFQTHYMKVYYSLLNVSDELLRRNNCSWLDQPQLYVLDIGAGSGAGTIALPG
jgi:hypothetical protein